MEIQEKLYFFNIICCNFFVKYLIDLKEKINKIFICKNAKMYYNNKYKGLANVY